LAEASGADVGSANTSPANCCKEASNWLSREPFSRYRGKRLNTSMLLSELIGKRSGEHQALSL
jgi:hypothetical protein